MARTFKITLMAALAALAALAAGCGTTASKSTASTQSPGTPSAAPSPSPAQSHQGKVGDKFTITSGDMKYDVTLLHVDQQARPESEYASAKPGHQLAAAQFRVTAITRTDENANNSATATGSNEQAYRPSLAPVAAGTNFAAGRVLLQPGSSLVGWVSFELPQGVRIARLQWTPASGFSTASAEWLVQGSATAPSSPGAATPGHTMGPAETVKAYYDAINLRDYQKAWELGGKNSESSYSSYVEGYKTTAMVSVQILDVSGDGATGVVTARLTTLETDGSSKVFEGRYTVKNGVIAEFSVRQAS